VTRISAAGFGLAALVAVGAGVYQAHRAVSRSSEIVKDDVRPNHCSVGIILDPEEPLSDQDMRAIRAVCRRETDRAGSPVVDNRGVCDYGCPVPRGQTRFYRYIEGGARGALGEWREDLSR
jgi:hypothetical protein